MHISAKLASRLGIDVRKHERHLVDYEVDRQQV